MEEMDNEGDWPDMHKKTIIPYSLFDEKLLHGNQNRRKRQTGLLSLDPPPHFDLVIVDEASQMKVTDFFVSAYSIKELGKFLIVGDDKQLPPVVIGEYPDDYKDKVSSIYNYLKFLTPKIDRIMLDSTYRFSKKIADFPSRAYYESNLKSKVNPEMFF